ncbi:MFS transporter [Cytophagales bacterium WSM2-2]|nr:MFS transporter [Cytophagales bacterium WSM2-2]
MIIPELPDFLTRLGGAEYKGLIISIFTLTALISRPFSGKLADRLGRKPVIIFGGLVCLICSLIYPWLTSMYGFFILRLFHGFSTGFSPTGVSAYVSDVIPAEKRGEAMGFMGTAGALGMAAGPAIGGGVANQLGLNWMFYLSSFFALVAVMIMLSVKETLRERHPISPALLKIKKEDLFEPLVIAPCLVMVLAAYAYGAVYTLLPDFGKHLGIHNKGLVFTFLTVSSLAVRLIAGKASDIYGRVTVLKITVALIVVGMVIIGLANQAWVLILGICLYGLAQGSTSPTLLAWATDLSHNEHRGRGIASLYISMELGIGLGALISGLVYANSYSNFIYCFSLAAVLSLIAFIFLITRKKVQGPALS